MNQRSWSPGDVFHRLAWMLALPLAGCGGATTPAVEIDASSDAGATVDRPVDRLELSEGDAGASPASVRASIRGDGGTALDAAVGNVWITRIVAATTDGGVSADDPPGFFVQDWTGAIFVAVDPAAISPAPQRGDLLVFRATRGDMHAGARWITALTGYYRGGNAGPADQFVEDLSAAPDLVSNLDRYEHHVVRVQGTVVGEFTEAGAGFESAQITTAGVPVATPDLVLRVPVALRSALGLRRGCTFTTLSPLWRACAQARVQVWTAAELTPGACPTESDGGADAGTSTDLGTIDGG